jgi:hypothetical protein
LLGCRERFGDSSLSGEGDELVEQPLGLAPGSSLRSRSVVRPNEI